ncbi:MAG: trypsin-like peptidase domain-containing protein [Bdellovibrionales bacterium]|nr:trypsin-like peptidase domain-containing protein [Ramlibacter sp.]
MRRTALYSRSGRPAAQAPMPAVQTAGPIRSALSRISPSSPRVLWSAIALLAMLLALSLSLSLRPGARKLTQEDIDKAVLHTLNNNVLPSAASKAYEKISASVVRVVSYSKALDKNGKETDQEVERGVGTGVVIVDKGVILTNLHVVSGAQTIKVTFSDGLESLATITGVQAENDLAVLQAQKIPDDMIAATMRSTGDLMPGDQVVAVGFPFGIGPSASAGIVSGLKRSFRSPEGKQEMRNLIQFDAAANPGNSGGPLVTMDGEVVGIVTAILNPTSARTFIGIGFAVPIENAAAAAGLPPF